MLLQVLTDHFDNEDDLAFRIDYIFDIMDVDGVGSIQRETFLFALRQLPLSPPVCMLSEDLEYILKHEKVHTHWITSEQFQKIMMRQVLDYVQRRIADCAKENLCKEEVLAQMTGAYPGAHGMTRASCSMRADQRASGAQHPSCSWQCWTAWSAGSLPGASPRRACAPRAHQPAHVCVHGRASGEEGRLTPRRLRASEKRIEELATRQDGRMLALLQHLGVKDPAAAVMPAKTGETEEWGSGVGRLASIGIRLESLSEFCGDASEGWGEGEGEGGERGRRDGGTEGGKKGELQVHMQPEPGGAPLLSAAAPSSLLSPPAPSSLHSARRPPTRDRAARSAGIPPPRFKLDWGSPDGSNP